MTNTIVLENSLKEKIPYLDGDQYKQILFKSIEYIFLNDERMRKFSIHRRNEYYKKCVCIPIFVDGTKVAETEEQRNSRLLLKQELETRANPEVSINEEAIIDLEGYISIDIAVNSLGISKKHLTSLIRSTGGIKSCLYNHKKLLHKQSLLDYLNINHCDGTGVTGYKIIGGKVGSEAYKEAWKRYFINVPEEHRVIKNDAKIEDIEGGIGERIYDIYLKICDDKIEEIPKLYPINILAPELCLNSRTLSRYCQKGVLSFYKMGVKYMFSKEDINKAEERINKYKARPFEKTIGSGKRPKIDNLLIELSLGQMIPNKSFKELIKEYTDIYFSLQTLISKNEKKVSFYKKNNLLDILEVALDENKKIEKELETLKRSIIDKYLEL